VTRIVCADMSVRATHIHLHCLRTAVSASSSLSADELDWHSESVLRRWIGSGEQLRAHVEALVILLLQSPNPIHHARALVWLKDALRYQLLSGTSFVTVVDGLFHGGTGGAALDVPHREALNALLGNLPTRHLLYWPDLNWSQILLVLVSNGEYDAFFAALNTWFAVIPSPTLLKETFFTTPLAALARAQQRSLAETVVSEFMVKRAGLTPTTHTYGVMIQMYGRCGDIQMARRWYEQGQKVLRERKSVFYIQMLDAEAFLGEWADVKRVAETMIQEVGEDSNPNMYTTVLEAMIRKSNFDELDVWMNRAKERGDVDDKLLDRYQACLRMRAKLSHQHHQPQEQQLSLARRRKKTSNDEA
jgi:pentatricopeptide repeat protein